MDKLLKAIVIEKSNNKFTISINELHIDDLPKDEVLIKVAYSSMNYKDGLASSENGKIVTKYPFIPGIDLSGIVISSKSANFQKDDKVIVTGYELGVSHFGGFAEYACVPAEWIVPLPKLLTLKEAMIYGTAGFTAALSIQQLERNGMAPDKGNVLVTGATGGVGSMAIMMLKEKGYHIIASSGKIDKIEYLKNIGASEVISRDEVYGDKLKSMDKQQWMYAIDPVGGNTLAAIISKLQYGGAVAVSGLTGGSDVHTTVFPFILRGVNILGIDSVFCPMNIRKSLWDRMANDLKPNQFIYEQITLEDLPKSIDKILHGKNIGRTIVKISNEDLDTINK